jgi:hypothetical protein
LNRVLAWAEIVQARLDVGARLASQVGPRQRIGLWNTIETDILIRYALRSGGWQEWAATIFGEPNAFDEFSATRAYRDGPLAV